MVFANFEQTGLLNLFRFWCCLFCTLFFKNKNSEKSFGPLKPDSPEFDFFSSDTQ